MNRYRVLLNGQNFLLNFDGKVQKIGFYTTRVVEAESFEAAESKAIEIIKEDETLKNNALNEENDSPLIFVDDLKILEADEKRLKNSGFSFYTEEEDGTA